MVEEPLNNDNIISPSHSPTENIYDPESEESTNSPENELNELNILEEDLLCVVCRYL